MLINPQLSVHYPNNLWSMVQHLQSNLETIQPRNSEVTQLITYTLIGAALVGMFIYHYLKTQEETN